MVIAPGWKAIPAFLLAASLGLAACAPSDEGAEASAGTEQAPTEADLTPTPIAQAPAADKKAVPLGEGFDFYVLALSWSPSYCEAEGADANRQQCETARPYAFIVHGLWPQFEHGFPQECGTDEPKVSKETLRTLYDIMPSAGLIRHEWQTHGSCTGLDQSDYFKVLRAAREKVTIPAGFRRLENYLTLSPGEAEVEFLKANPDLPPDGVAVTCDKRYLREVRICMTKDLAFRACDEIDRRSCRNSKVVLPPVRGG